jgi:hypothetical protein
MHSTISTVAQSRTREHRIPVRSSTKTGTGNDYAGVLGCHAVLGSVYALGETDRSSACLNKCRPSVDHPCKRSITSKGRTSFEWYSDWNLSESPWRPALLSNTNETVRESARRRWSPVPHGVKQFFIEELQVAEFRAQIEFRRWIEQITR